MNEFLLIRDATVTIKNRSTVTVSPLETGETVEPCNGEPGPGQTGATVDRGPVRPVQR